MTRKILSVITAAMLAASTTGVFAQGSGGGSGGGSSGGSAGSSGGTSGSTSGTYGQQFRSFNDRHRHSWHPLSLDYAHSTVQR